MITFEEPAAKDDPQLTELISTPMPGSLSLSFGREPSYLQACRFCGPRRQVLAAREGSRVLALCSRFRRTYRVGNQPRDLFIVSDFRVRPEAGCRGITGQGWRALRPLLGDCPALISVVGDNRRALQLFCKARPHWPRLHKVADLRTHLYPLLGVRCGRGHRDVGPVSVRDLVDLFQDEALHGDYSTVLEAGDLGTVLPSAGSFWGVYRRGRLRAVAGLWDPSKYRQITVEGYSGAFARLRRLRCLPAPGTRVKVLFLVGFAYRTSQEAGLLLSFLRSRARRLGASFLVWGDSGRERPPGSPLWPRLCYRSALFQLCWEGDQTLPVCRRSGPFEVAWL